MRASVDDFEKNEVVRVSKVGLSRGKGTHILGLLGAVVAGVSLRHAR